MHIFKHDEFKTKEPIDFDVTTHLVHSLIMLFTLFDCSCCCCCCCYYIGIFLFIKNLSIFPISFPRYFLRFCLFVYFTFPMWTHNKNTHYTHWQNENSIRLFHWWSILTNGLFFPNGISVWSNFQTQLYLGNCFV